MKQRWMKIAGWGFLAGIILSGAAVGLMMWQIHRAVSECCASAQQAFPKAGDDAPALMQVVMSDQFSLKERNLAVWTLGRIRDPGALFFLQTLYTGEPCDHERFLCQYESAKAIKRCGGIPDPQWKSGH